MVTLFVIFRPYIAIWLRFDFEITLTSQKLVHDKAKNSVKNLTLLTNK